MPEATSATETSLMILIAGPYRSGTGDDPERMAQNLRTLEKVALPLYRAAHSADRGVACAAAAARSGLETSRRRDLR